MAYFEISPIHKQKKKIIEKEEAPVPVLRLTQFTHSPKINFDNVKLGLCKKRKLLIYNVKDQEQEVLCERYPTEKSGFFIEEKLLILQPGESKEVNLSWTPQSAGNIRELIHWKSNLGVRAQTVLLGTCIDSSKEKFLSKERHRVKPLKPHNSTVTGFKESQCRERVHSTKGCQGSKFPKKTVIGSENRPPFECGNTGRASRNSSQQFKVNKVNSSNENTFWVGSNNQKANCRGKDSSSSHSSTEFCQPLNSTEFVSKSILRVPSLEVSAIFPDATTVKHRNVVWDEETIEERDSFSNIHTEVTEDIHLENEVFFGKNTNQQTLFDVIQNIQPRRETYFNSAEESSFPQSNINHSQFQLYISNESAEISSNDNTCPSPLRRQTFIKTNCEKLNVTLPDIDNSNQIKSLKTQSDALMINSNSNKMQQTLENTMSLFSNAETRKCEDFSDFSKQEFGHSYEANILPIGKKRSFEADGLEQIIVGSELVADHLKVRKHLKRNESKNKSLSLISDASECFVDSSKGLPSCDVEASPLRRQTYIKTSSEEKKTLQSQLPDKVTKLSMSTVLQSNEDNFLQIVNTCQEANNINDGTILGDISATYLSPEIDTNGKSLNIQSSCKNLLVRLDCLLDSFDEQNVESPMAQSFPLKTNCPSATSAFKMYNAKSQFHSMPEISNINLCKSFSEEIISKSFNENNAIYGTSFESEICDSELMHTASTSPTLEFVTAPTTPVDFFNEETLIKEDANCDETQEFPTPKIGNCNMFKPLNISELSELLSKQALITDDYEMNHQKTLSPFPNLFDHSEEEVEGFSSELQQRLSNGTVIVETSILHPMSIVNIDLLDNCQRDLTISGNYEDYKNTSPNCCDQLPNLLLEDKCCYESDTLNELLIYKGEKTFNEIKNISVISSVLETPKQSSNVPNTLAPLEDFSFIHTEDPKRCSTGIKSQTSKLKNPNSERKSNSCMAKSLFITETIQANHDDQQSHVLPSPDIKFGTPLSLYRSYGDLSIADMAISDSISKNNDQNTFPNNNTSTIEANAAPKSEEKMFNRNGLTFIEISKPVKSNYLFKKKVSPRPAVKVCVKSLKASPRIKIKHSSTFEVPSIRKKEKKLKAADMKIGYPNNSRNLKENTRSRNFLAKKTARSTTNLACKDKILTKSTLKLENTNSLCQSTISLASTTSSTTNVSVSSKFPQRLNMKKYNPRLSHSRLILSKAPRSSVLVHHPNPYAAKNMYYDDRWVEKQIAGFTKWLNFVLTPPEEENTVISPKTVNIAKLWMEASRCSNMQKAPSRETMSLKTYTVRMRLGRLRRAAFKHYQSSNMAIVINKVEMAIEKKLLIIRKDRQTHADMGLKENLLKLMLSYNPLWLRIGLETVYGEVLFISSNNDITGITHFLINRFLYCPDIAKRFAHHTVPHCYKQGFDEAIKVFQLKKFLLLVYFLDTAKESRLIDHDPCLFNKESEFKSSREVLLSFAREFLSGVGDITKHLAYMGYIVSHQQTSLDEFDFSVVNLATDLRCGIRLTRVVETLFQDFKLSRNLRIPAVSRLQKVHNTDIALNALANSGYKEIKTKFSSKDIVEGHREKTLGLLWEIIFHLQIRNVISISRLLEEIHHLKKSLFVKSTLDEIARMGVKIMTEDKFNLLETDKDTSSTEFILQLLKFWVRLVCAHYGIEIDNMTVSFCDGRAFCYLLHHYHPELLKKSEINDKTTQNMDMIEPDLDASLDESFSNSVHISDDEVATRMKNEKFNFNLFIQKLNELGAVPILISPSDMVNTIPDEKVTTTFLAYFCARLLDLSTEIKSARIIQIAWRKKLAEKKLKLLELQAEAIVKIQTWWRNHMVRQRAILYIKSAIVIQSYWRRKKAIDFLKNLRIEKELRVMNKSAAIIQSAVQRFLVRQRVKRNEAASKIQKCWKAYLIRTKFLKTKRSVIIIQSCVRMWISRNRYQHALKKIISMQQKYKGKLLTRRTQNIYQSHIKTIIMLQTHIRGFLSRKSFQNKKLEIMAAAKIISFLKMAVEKKRYMKFKNAAIVLQKNFRRFSQKQLYIKQKLSAICIQRYWRNCVVAQNIRKEYLELRIVAVIIQSNYRTYLQQRKFKEMKNSAIKIQCNFRGWLMRRKFCSYRTSATQIQKWWRRLLMGRIDKEYLIAARSSVLKIQSFWRGFVASKSYRKLLHATICIQSHFRRRKLEMAYKEKLQSCIKVQAFWRMYKARKEYLQLKYSAVVIQIYFRSYLLTQFTQKEYTLKRQSCIKIQSFYRKCVALRVYQRYKRAATIIQSWFRSCIITRQIVTSFKKTKMSCITIQKFYRMWKQRRQYQLMKRSVVIIQNRLRGYFIMKKERERFLTKVKAVKILQSRFRKWRERKIYKKKQSSAIKIQSLFRKFSLKKKFILLKAATCVIQRAYRRFKLRKVQESIKQETASIIFQKNWRCILSRRQFLNKINAAIIIQRNWRCIINKRRFLEKRKAIIVIQKNWRCFTYRRQYMMSRRAIVTLQAIWRCKVNRRQFLKKKEATVALQKNWKCILTRRQFLEKKRAVVILQKNWRCFFYQKLFLEKREAIVTIQKNLRCALYRRQFLEKKSAIVVLQKNWRCLINRRRYLVTMRAIVTLQKNMRCIFYRRQFLKKRKAIITIQKNWRSIFYQRLYLKQKLAVVTLQKNWRCAVNQRDFLVKRKAAITFQKNWRCVFYRRQFLKKRRAIVSLQKNWRCAVSRKRFLEKKRAVMSLQKNWRCYINRKLFLEKKQAIVTLQKNWRCIVDRRQFLRKRKAIVLLQKNWRCFIRRSKFIRKRNAAIILQKSWRSFICRHSFLKMRCASVIIQKNWRCNVNRIDFLKKKRAIIIMQKNVRRWILRRRFLVYKFAAQAIQSWYRASLLGKSIRDQFVSKKNASIVIQKYFKGFLVRQRFKKMFTASVCIQSYWRKRVAWRDFSCKKSAAIMIQRYWRSYRSMKECQERFYRIRSGIVALQACFRKCIVRRRYMFLRSAVIMLQAHIRGKKVRDEIKRRKLYATKLQAWYRGCIVRRHFCKQREAVITLQRIVRTTQLCKAIKTQNLLKQRAAIVIQSFARGHFVRRRLKLMHIAATKIQAVWKMHIAKTELDLLKCSAIVIQQFYLNYRAGNKIRLNYLNFRSSMIVLQSHIRGYIQRKRYCFVKLQIIKLQSYWRMQLKRRQFLKMVKASKTIQTFYRSNKLLQIERARTTAYTHSLILCQAVIKGHLCRKQLQINAYSAVKIQRFYRHYRQRKTFLRNQQISAIKIQARFRTYRCRKDFLIKKLSACKIQHWFRQCKKRQRISEILQSTLCIQSYFRGYQVRKRIRKENNSATLIQSYFKMWVARKNYEHLSQAVLIIQRYWRTSCMIREEENQRILKGAAILIQSVWRGYLVRKQAQNQKAILKNQEEKSIYIQKWWRRLLLTKNLQEQYQVKRRAAMTIQRYFKIWKLNKLNQSYHATKIQSYWRMYRQRVIYLQLKKHISVIECWWRAQLQRKADVVAQSNMKSEAAAKIQVWWRTRLAVQDYQRKMAAVIKLQMYWGGAIKTLCAREYFIYLRRASVIIQAAWRGRQQRKLYKKMLAALVIQRAWRRMKFRKERMASAILIQRLARGYIERRKFLRTRNSVIIIQRFWRKYIKNKKTSASCAATKIQATWRGYKLRQRMLSNRRVTIIRGRLITATANACESKKIGNRTAVAINYLLKFKDLKSTLIAVMYLDTSTKWSPPCCEKLVKENGTRMVIELIHSCNRSVPHMEILGYALNILINLLKYHVVSPTVLGTPNLVSSTVQLMKMYYEKEHSLFNKCSTILYIIACTNSNNQALCSTKVRADINSIFTILKRRVKAKIDNNKKVLAPIIKCPSLSPEWSMKPSEIREFTQPFSAVASLKSKLIL